MALSFAVGAYSSSILCKATIVNNHSHAQDLSYIRRAAQISDKSAGFTSPHPNFGCVIATRSGEVAGEGYLYAQGTKPAEVLVVEAAGERCRDATAYLNMEPGDCHGDHTAVSALVQVQISHRLGLTKEDQPVLVSLDRPESDLEQSEMGRISSFKLFSAYQAPASLGRPDQ